MKMTAGNNKELGELAQRALQQAHGDQLTAVKLLRDQTDLGVLAALEVIKALLHQRGERCNLVVVGHRPLTPHA
jgi:hypothetical protein